MPDGGPVLEAEYEEISRDEAVGGTGKKAGKDVNTGESRGSKKRKLSLFTEESRKKIKRSHLKFPIITARALRDMFTVRRVVTYLIILCAVPALVATLVPEEIASYTLDMQVVKLTDYLFTLSFVWIAGIPLVFMSAGTISSMTSSEINEGTVLQLVSRPLRRWEVIIGKFLAFFILFAFVEVVAFIVSTYLLIYFSGCHLSIFWPMLAFLPPLLLYSFIVAVFFGSIALLLSTLIRKTALTIVIMAFLVMIFYLGFLFIRLLGGDYYRDYYLYYIDVGYILGNVFITLLEGFSIDLSPNFQLIFGFTSGTFDPAAFMDTTDHDQGFQLTTLPPTAHVGKGLSMAIAVLLPWVFIILAMMRMEKMEVG